MNVLMISLDATLLMDKEKVVGDSKERHILYGKYLSNLFIVVLPPKQVALKTKRLSENVIAYSTSSRKLFAIRDAYRIGKKICQKNKIDVITTQDPLLTGLIGYFLKRRFNIPLNMQLHGNYLDNEFHLKNSKLFPILNIIGKSIVKKADCIRAVSSLVEDDLVSKIGIPRERIVTFPVFTNIDKFMSISKTTMVQDKYIRFDSIVIFIGALIRRKNIEAFINAASEVIKSHPRTLFLIIGEGPEKMRLLNMVVRLGLRQNVKFEGKVAHQHLPSYYQASSLFVLPSKEDGWGLVVVEALASGKPVIVSDACGTKDIVDRANCGFVFPANRPDILAQKIIYLLDNPKIGGDMGERGKEYVKEVLDINKNVFKYKELYQKTMELARM